MTTHSPTRPLPAVAYYLGALVIPVYLVPALTLTLALGLAAESRSWQRQPRSIASAIRRGHHVGAVS